MKKLFSILISCFSLFLLISCGGPSINETKNLATDSTASALVKDRYVCPMDTDIVSNHPDKCSKCGMELEKVN